MTCLLEILNNTFVGTLLAGSLLAVLGLKLYRWQKSIDIKYEDLRKLREQASLLFAQIEIASKNCEAQINIYNGENREIQKLNEILNEKFNNHFSSEFEKEFNLLTTKITKTSDDLIAQLKIHNKNEPDVESLVKSIPIFNIHLLGTITLKKYSSEQDVKEFAKNFRQVSGEIKVILQKLINTSL